MTPRILVRAPNWIGDQVMAYPFFHFLRKANPRAQIAVACVPWVQDIQFRNLVDEVIVLPRPNSDRLGDRLRAVEDGATQARARGPWDLGIALPNSISTAWFLKRANVRRRRGYRMEGRGLLLNEALRWDSNSARHRAQAYVDLLPEHARPSRDIREFWGVPPENDLDQPVEGELAAFDALEAWPLRDEEYLKAPEGPYWVLAPGATADSRRWPASYFAHLARRITEDTGWPGVIVGGPKESGLADELCRDRSLNLIDLVAEGSVPSLYRIFNGAQFTVTNESGLAHVAALCGSFVQIVCGAADPLRTRPLGPGRVQVAVNPIECWPCERNTCALEPPAQKFSCLLGIQPDMVWSEIKRGIRRA